MRRLCAEYRWEISRKNPVAGTQYLRTVLDGLVEEILRSSRKSQRPYRGGLIFGVIEWFFHSVEETGRKFLHGHGIARAASAPKTFQRLNNCNKMKNKNEEFLYMPILPSVHNCP